MKRASDSDEQPAHTTGDLNGASLKAPRGVIRLAIADEQPLFVDGATKAFEGEEDIEVAILALTGEELVSRIAGEPLVDAVLIDPWMRCGDGLESVARIHAGYPDLSIIAMSGLADPGHVNQAMDSGVVAYVSKGTLARDLPAIIRHVVSGGVILPAMGGAVQLSTDLTARELEVLKMASEGLSNGEIASALYITEQTVKFHLGNIYRKLGVANRTEAAFQGMRRGLIG